MAHLHWSPGAAFGLETVEEVCLGILMLFMVGMAQALGFWDCLVAWGLVEMWTWSVKVRIRAQLDILRGVRGLRAIPASTLANAPAFLRWLMSSGCLGLPSLCGDS